MNGSGRIGAGKFSDARHDGRQDGGDSIGIDVRNVRGVGVGRGHALLCWRITFPGLQYPYDFAARSCETGGVERKGIKYVRSRIGDGAQCESMRG